MMIFVHVHTRKRHIFPEILVCGSPESSLQKLAEMSSGYTAWIQLNMDFYDVLAKLEYKL
jgi:hypothetical protein